MENSKRAFGSFIFVRLDCAICKFNLHFTSSNYTPTPTHPHVVKSGCDDIMMTSLFNLFRIERARLQLLHHRLSLGRPRPHKHLDLKVKVKVKVRERGGAEIWWLAFRPFPPPSQSSEAAPLGQLAWPSGRPSERERERERVREREREREGERERERLCVVTCCSMNVDVSRTNSTSFGSSLRAAGSFSSSSGLNAGSS